MALALLAGTIALAGCRSGAPGGAPAESRSPSVEILPSRVDVAPGLAPFLPVSRTPGGRGVELPRLRLDDGREVPATLVWIGTRRGATSASERWMELPGEWTSHEASVESDTPRGRGFWGLSLDMPPDAAGQDLWVRVEGVRRRIEVNWLPEEGYLAATVPPAAWRPPLGAEATSRPGLATFLERARRDPFERWRVRLLETGLAPEASRDAPPDDAFADPYLEALAGTLEARWRSATATLAEEDPALAARLRRRLCAVADVGWGLWAPAWHHGPAEVDALLDRLLDPDAPRASRLRGVHAWLEAQPEGMAWVIDDAGLDERGGRRRVSTVGLCNLSDGRQVAWAAPEGQARIDDLVPLEPGTTVRLAVPVPLETGANAGSEANGGTGRIIARLGQWSRVLEVRSEPLPATPPGALIGPLFHDWTARSWVRGEPMAESDEAGRTRALCQRGAGGGPTDWSIYVEAGWPADGAPADPDEDSVRLWFGHYGRASPVIRVRADGRTTREEATGTTGVNASVLREEDRWIAVVPVPPEVIEPDGTIRVGIERIRGDGRRTAWPRAMHPWQTEPGRIAIDTTAWEAGR